MLGFARQDRKAVPDFASLSPCLSSLHQTKELWFPDGNIILITNFTAFKVHRGQLQRHSEVFEDMLSLPQPKNMMVLDNCAWVELHDHPSDVFHFLLALYDGLYFKTPAMLDFPALAAVLRLSSKYLVEHLRQRCMVQLEHDWPSSLAAWDIREQEATDTLGRYLPLEHYPHPILVIELALELGLDDLLAAAFYDLSRYGPSKVAGGVDRLSPALPLYPPGHEQRGSNPRVEIPIACLSDRFLVQTFLGREANQSFVAEFLRLELAQRSVSSECTTESRFRGAQHTCRDSFYYIRLNIMRSVGGIACGRDGDALYTLLQAVQMLSRTDFSDGSEGGKTCGLSLCEPCKEDFRKSVQSAREEVWRKAPSWFGL